ncbi:MAG: hypothetical protein TH68_09520, partial [Candidatus Synechococcus spongiarum 142]
MQEAIDCFRKVLTIEPNSLVALINLIDCYKKVLAINPNSLTTLIKLSGALQEQGKLEEAI